MPSFELKRHPVELKKLSFEIKLAVNVEKISQRRSKKKRPEQIEKKPRESSSFVSSSVERFQKALSKSKVAPIKKKPRSGDPAPPHCHGKELFLVVSLQSPQKRLPALAGPSNRCANVERKLQWQFIIEGELPLTYVTYHEQLHALDNAHQGRKDGMKMLIQNLGGKTHGEGRLDAGLVSLLGRLTKNIRKLHDLVVKYAEHASQCESLARGRMLVFDLERCTDYLESVEDKLRNIAQDAALMDEMKETPGMLERIVRPEVLRSRSSVGRCIVAVEAEVRKLKSQARPPKHAAFRLLFE